MSGSNPLWRGFRWWLLLLPPLPGAIVDAVLFGLLLSPLLFRGSTGTQAVLFALVLGPFAYASHGLRVHVRRSAVSRNPGEPT